MAQSLRPTIPASSVLASMVSKRHYHEDVVYGYRVPKEFQYPDYTPEQLANRQKQAALVCLVNAYRSSGHRATDLDPLGIQKKSTIPELDPARYGLEMTSDKLNIDGILEVPLADGSKMLSIAEINKTLEDIYCGHVAFEFEHIPDTAEKRWFADYVEATSKDNSLGKSKKRRFYELLARSEASI
ncbi:hypothetical protein LPJ73_003375 [Coemansia sp. RSA 2703]|nr:hypothetical protein LPJ73_003375 [Coemansia sp. RSA 2703]